MSPPRETGPLVTDPNPNPAKDEPTETDSNQENGNRGMTWRECRDLADKLTTAGIPCFPIALKWNLDTKKVGKRPTTPHGHDNATTDPDKLADLFRRYVKLKPGEWPGVGTYPGPARYLVLDFDNLDTLAALEAEHGPIPGRRVRTASGNLHIWQRLPAGVTIAQTSPWKGVDIRSSRGWVVAPGVRSPWGNWTVEGGVVVDAPEWIISAILDHEKGPVVIPSEAEPGDRHETLVKLISSMRGKGLPQAAVLAAARGYNREQCKPPKPDDELVKIVDWAFTTLEPPQTAGKLETPTSPEAIDQEVEKELGRLRIRHRAEQKLRGELASPPRPLNIVSLAEMLAAPLPPIEWRLDGWQPKDTRGNLTAAFKAGKTTVIGNLLRSLVDGDDFLDTIEAVPLTGAIGLLDFEMSTRMLTRWLSDQRIGNTDQVVPIPMRGNAGAFNIVNPDTRSEWAERLRRYGITYLILDPLRPVLDALGLNEHTDAGIFLQAFDQLLVEADITEALVSHHHGHGAERARGDSRLRDWPDFEWKLVRQDEDPASARYISAYGRDIDVGESLLTYDEETRRLTLTGGSRRYAEVRGALVEIEKVLDAQGSPSAPMTQNAVERALEDSEHSRGIIRKALSHGVKEGRLVVTPGPNKAKLYTRCASAPEYATARRRTGPVSGAPPIYIGAPPNTTEPGRDEKIPPAHPLPFTGDPPSASEPCPTPDLCTAYPFRDHLPGCPADDLEVF